MSRVRYIDKVYSALVDEFDDSIIMFIRSHCEELLETLPYFCDLLEEIPYQKYEYESYLSSTDTINICRDFIKDVIPNYLESFDDCVSSGVVDLKETEDENENAVYQIVKEKDKTYHEIIIPLKHNIEDVYSLLHEFIHYTNPFDSEGKKSADSYVLAESTSIFFEFVLYDYLKSKDNKEDIKNPIQNRIIDCKTYCSSLLYNLDYLYEIDSNLDEEYHYIDNVTDLVEELYSKRTSKETDENYESVDSIKNSLVIDTLYALGNIIAIMKYYDYKNDRISIKNMIAYNDSLHLNNNLESLNHIFINMPSEEEMKDAVDYLKDDLFGKRINK